MTEAREGSPLGCRFLFDQERRCLMSLHAATPPPLLLDSWRPTSLRPLPQHQAGVAYLPLWPRVRLVIVGGGHVGQAVGELAVQADFEVWVLDDREAYASAERFPRAARRMVGDVARTLMELKNSGSFGPTTFAIIVTRGHQAQLAALGIAEPGPR